MNAMLGKLVLLHCRSLQAVWIRYCASNTHSRDSSPDAKSMLARFLDANTNTGVGRVWCVGLHNSGPVACECMLEGGFIL